MNTTTSPVILITGSAKRIGAEIARQAHANGYRVVVHYHHSKTEAMALVNELNAIRVNTAKSVQADLAIINDKVKLDKFVDKVIGCFGSLFALVNNASRFYPSPIQTSKSTDSSYHQLLQAWDELFLTNAKASFFLTKALLPYLQQNQGNVINLLDIHADGKPFVGYPIYNMAKSAGRMMVQSLALELAPMVRVNGVAPGVNVFPEHDSDQAIDRQQQVSICQSIPMQRVGTPADIAGAVIYLLQADYVTGQIISVDGGRSLTIRGG